MKIDIISSAYKFLNWGRNYKFPNTAILASEDHLCWRFLGA